MSYMDIFKADYEEQLRSYAESRLTKDKETEAQDKQHSHAQSATEITKEQPMREQSLLRGNPASLI